jgi:hypothetical protein
MQCICRRIKCDGYDIHLVWVDSKTGYYEPQQRRAYPCEQTWRGYPSWSLRDVGRLIDTCDDEDRFCQGQASRSPFHVFSSHEQNGQKDQPSTPSTGTPSSTQQMEPEGLSEDVFGTLLDDEEDFTVNGPTSRDTGGILSPDSSASNDLLEATCSNTLSKNSHRDLIIRHDHLPSSLFSPSSFRPCENRTENWLFYHYTTYVSLIMIPVDDGRNPWKSTYPSMALQDMSMSSSRSLYHAILAQAALNIANLKGSDRGAEEKLQGLRYFGMALRELQHSLESPKQDYSTLLAALLTITFVQDVFLGGTPGWRRHFRGAADFVLQYLSQQPWRESFDAWVITQNFVLSAVLAQTVTKCGAEKSADSASAASIADRAQVLAAVMERSTFGFTVGGTARMIRVINQIRVLEEDMNRVDSPHDENDVTRRVGDIIQQLSVPLDQEVHVFSEQGSDADIKMSSQIQSKTLFHLHLHLFNKAIMIYLLSVVLKQPPASTSDYVWEVLSAMAAFIDMNGTSVSPINVLGIFQRPLSDHLP